jgi:hypothetical protein
MVGLPQLAGWRLQSKTKNQKSSTIQQSKIDNQHFARHS